MKQLDRFFASTDRNGDGRIDLPELKGALAIPKIGRMLRRVDIDPHEMIELFHLIDKNRDGDLDRDEFILGITKLKGGTRAVDFTKLNVQLNALTTRALFFDKEMKRIGHLSKVEEKFGEHNFQVFSEMRGRILYIDP